MFFVTLLFLVNMMTCNIYEDLYIPPQVQIKISDNI